MPVPSRNQWYYSGGFCGALSIQSIALSHGVYLSQKLIRQAAPPGGGHGDRTDGYEILHTNIQTALDKLKFSYNRWNYETEPTPQSNAYLAWLKQELASGHAVVWFIMCSGDNHNTYGLAAYDHIEPVFGIFSNRTLTDLNVYPDDVLVHGSDWDQNGYYRPFNSLVDSSKNGPKLTGNCSKAVPTGGGPNEAYPCLMNLIDYGWSIKGLMDPEERLVPTNLAISGNGQEPHTGQPLTTTITIPGPLKAGSKYITYRWDGTLNFPTDSKFEQSNFSTSWAFEATQVAHSFEDKIDSSTAVYYGTIAA